MHSKLNKLYNRFASKKTKTQDFDPDYLVDYEEPPPRRTRKLSKESLTKQFDKCKEMIVKKSGTEPRCNNAHFNYTLEYTEKGRIKRPTYYVESTGAVYYIPITMDVIRSLILKQHCKINRQEEIVWFEDGLKWLSQQQYQTAHSSSQNDDSQHRYFIEEEGNYYDEKKNCNQIRELEDLERACEAYFGIPLGLCENSWAAEYLISQASKGKLLRRVTLQPSLRKVSFSLKKLCCF
ncbi:hypothetical protein EDC94DRAFT_601984 [Helicostylum pulchrum]|uniref:Uncharacterized protein n=1 Tax=Helicostylum pulchrum TaxID=562976 RepID=A0ABP9XVJ7_9FUNG|nr:hypothetical protein EDC94DRAFT_601984 [Helicostylum pulchrum]